MDISDDKIKTFLESYKERLEKKRIHYHEVLKHDPEFMQKNRDRAQRHFEENKEKKKQYYQDNKEIKRLNNYYYNYKKQNRLPDLKKKHPEIYQKLIDNGKIQEEEE